MTSRFAHPVAPRPGPGRSPAPRGTGPALPDEMCAEVIAGLKAPQKTLPPKLFYDERGAALFHEITALDEYYLTRTELGIMRAHAGDMADLMGAECALVELGSGEALKVRLLLDRLRRPAAYVPVDISAEQLQRVAADIARAYPGLLVVPVAADYTAPFSLPELPPPAREARRVAYFPGSTIGNFHLAEAVAFLRRIARLCGPGGALLVGADLRKDPNVLHAAYNDAAGVTAAFNMNMLVRLNRELGASFDPARFRHYAYYNPVAGRVEMHLVSLARQTVSVDGECVRFERGESVWTESSYKYAPRQLDALARDAGFDVAHAWTDPREWFCVLYLVVRGGDSDAQTRP
jgi:L-histidine Nalpha-methyltransferase